MRDQPVPDHAIAALAERQGGVVEHTQLLALGLSRAAIHRRVRAGRLHARFRGVYAVGHRRLAAEGLRWAAVLACGSGAVLSHTSGAVAWGLLRSTASRLDVTVPRGGREARPGIRLHRSRRLAPDEVTTLDGLPITTPARTLLDLAADGLRGRRLESALDRAELLRLVDFAHMHELLERYPRRAGTSSLRAVLSRYAAGTVDTRSVLEELVLGLCDAHGLPRPNVNTVIEGRERDFCWPHAMLVVEADSYAWHRSPSALDDDRERDVRLALAGYVPLRFTYEQCTKRRGYVRAAILQGLLEHRPGAAVASRR